MGLYESIDNPRLICNGLELIEFELGRESTSYFRVAREAHQALYRSLIEALKGTANISVTGKRKGRREYWYRRDDGYIREIHKEPISGCELAWRFSNPAIVGSFPRNDSLPATSNSEDYLISFYDALAMVQTECFAHQYVHSQEVQFTDEEMKLLEWLHENIRNRYEHFVPMSYSAPIRDLLLAAQVAVSKARASVFDSHNVLFFDHSVPEASFRDKFDNVLAMIDSAFDRLDKAPADQL